MMPNAYDPPKWEPPPRAKDEGPIQLGEAVGLALAGVYTCGDDVGEVCEWLMAYLSDWADEIRREANEATAAKLVAKERWQ